MDSTMQGRLGPEETQAVLRRAAELDREHAPAAPPTGEDLEPRIEASELERIAAESGLSPESVRRALDELGGGALGPSRPKPGTLDRAAAATAERTFEIEAPVLEQRLSVSLRRGGLEPVKIAPHATRWAPAVGLQHTLRRAANLGGSSAFIGSAVETEVYAVPGGRSAARLRGNARDLLAPIATVAGLLLAFPAGLALLVVLGLGVRWGFSAQHALALLLVVGCWALLTALISRGVARGRVRKLQRALERTLRELAEPPPPLH